MMNPQYPPPGQNNNAPSNPLYPPISQDYNGVQNANYGPTNGPQKYDQDVAQKMQNMNLNGPQGFAIPPSQLPPGQIPPNFSGQLPPGPRPGMPGPPRPPASQLPPGVGGPKQLPPSSTPGPLPTSHPQAFGVPPQSQTPGLETRQMPIHPAGGPPTQQIPGMNPGQVPPNSQPGLTQPAGMGRPPMPTGPLKSGLPPQQQMGGAGYAQGAPLNQPQTQGRNIQMQGPGQPGLPQSNQPGLPPSSQPGFPGQHGLPPQPGQMSGPGQPPTSQAFQSSQQGVHPPGQPGLPPLPLQAGLPPPGQSGLTPQLGQPSLPPGQSGLPPQPGIPQQPGPPAFQQPQRLPPQPGMQGQVGLPPQPGMPGQPGLHTQINQGGPPSMHNQSGPRQPGISGQPGMPGQSGPMQPGLPGQPGLPPQPGYPNQQFQSALPHMPPPLTQQRQFPGMQPAPQPGYGQPAPPSNYSGMPPQPHQAQPLPSQPGFPQQPSSGYPPQYGQQPQYPGHQPYPGQQYQQPPQQKKLDPDQMPSPIQVVLDDQQNRGGIFVTNEKGLVPPLVTTDFIVDDKGNASPRYIRSSMYTVPVTADLLKQTSMPFCLVISPMAETVGTELEPPLLDFATLTGSPTMGPVRCSRCKAYMCPNMKFVDAGRHFKCPFCKATTEVPMEYTQYVNSMQQYGRVPAEMALGAYEIVATKEYCRNNTLPNPPAIVFVIDVSYNAIKSGMVQTICENILNIIEEMPKDEQTGKSWTRVGIITYSSTVHFYNIKGTLAQPQMMSVGDVADMFVPLLEGFLVLPEESGPVLHSLLQELPSMFQDNKETETILLPAVQAGLEALKAADTSGQLLVFHTTLPSYNAPGKLINREDRKLLGTDKEKQIISPQTSAYNELGQACSAAGVCVEIFACNNSYVDAATIGQLPRLTGGQVHKYTYFTAEIDGPRLVYDVKRVVSRPTAHDAVMRVRTSTGVRATDFYGHFFMSNTTDVELAAIDADKAVGIEIKHDDKLTAEDGVYIQAALLYTHRSGQRRLRVLNLALNVAHQLADVYRSMELDTTINFLTKQAVWGLREHTPRQIREGLSARCAKSLAAYRRHCASPSSAGQLVLPESMKLLPLFTSCILRSDAISGGADITCDDRSCAMYRASTADVSTSVVYTYPRLLPLHRVAGGERGCPPPLRASVDKMNEHGVYLLENGVHMLLWVGSQAPPDFIQDVFGVPTPQQIDTQVCELPALDTPASDAVRAIVDDARARRRTAMRLTIMRQHDKLEAVLRHFLVEDRGVDGSSSYVDYLCHIHKEIRALL